MLLVLVLTGGALAWDHSLFTTSPPVYPSPRTDGIGWEDAFRKANEFVSHMTLEEKAYMVTGTSGPCVGNIAPIERLDFNGLCLMDGPLAVRQAIYASVFPAGLTTAASWDRNLTRLRGRYLGAEFVGKGSHIALGPVVGPLGRSPFGGRNWEGFSPDPYLSGVAVEETVTGMQSAGVQACVKHFIGNEQETQRNPTDANGATVEAVSSNIDDRTMHELYLWPFANAIRAGAAGVMASYNRLNGSYGSRNSKVLNGLLKGELGFQGYVVSDWGATHAGLAAMEAGLDMNMPGGIRFEDPEHSFFGVNIIEAVINGPLSVERVDDMVLRTVTPYFLLGQDQGYPLTDPSSASLAGIAPSDWLVDFQLGPEPVHVGTDAHAKLIRELGSAGTVLLKNTNAALPLHMPRRIEVFGDDAIRTGTLPVGGGSGTGHLPYVVPPLDAIKRRAAQDGTLVQYNNPHDLTSRLSKITLSSLDACLVFLKSYATEGSDRTTLLPESGGAGVVETVASICSNTIVVLHGTAPNTIPFSDHPNVTGILAAHFPGQETGNSLVDILWGDVNPSGRLPYTIAKQEGDYNRALTNSSMLIKSADPNAWQADFVEGQMIDYRFFDANGMDVRYEFGFGLSYTSFGITSFEIQTSSQDSTDRTPPPANTPLPPGGESALWQSVARVSTTVANTGSASGAAVLQLYVSLGAEAGPGTPVRSLRGFEKVFLQPGQSEAVEFNLMRRDVSFWDVLTQTWRMPSEGVEVGIGFSSRDLHFQSHMTV